MALIDMSLCIFKYRLLTICLMVSFFLLTGCKGSRTSSRETDNQSDKFFPVEVTKPSFEKVLHTLEAVGSFLPKDEVAVGAEVAGKINKLHIDEGSPVKTNQPLLAIDDEKFRLEVEETKAQLEEAQARLKNSQTNLNRMTSLFQDAIIGQNDFDDAQTQVSLNRAVVEKLQARLNRSKKSLRDTRVVAPIDGIISQRMVSIGEYVKVGAILVKVVDSNPLKLVFSLPEKNAVEIKTGQKVSISTHAYPGKIFEGTIYFINPKVDENTRTIEVKAWVDNSDYKLRPGFFVNVTVFLGEKRSLVLPESAVVVREGKVIVMVVEDGRIVYQKITPGFRFDGKVEILDGISTDDDIVFYGRNEISEGTRVKTLPSS
jgi:membrane fusion protein (multidrug efflux system)